jgi:DNA-binding transcriptional LysR family regulator
MEQVREADAAMSGHNAAPRGRLAVAVPPAFCLAVVAPNLAAFHATYPGIDLELVITSHGVDLLRDKVDLAVSVGALSDSEYITRTLISSRLLLVASPDYVARNEIGTTLQEIRRHIRICETRYGLARMPVHIGGKADSFAFDRDVTCANNPLVVRSAVMNGAGISPLPLHYCRDQIAEGSLVEVCRHVTFDQSATKLAVVYPGHRLVSPRLRAFLDFLDEICVRFGR